jgi:hypothetical protein
MRKPRLDIHWLRKRRVPSTLFHMVFPRPLDCPRFSTHTLCSIPKLRLRVFIPHVPALIRSCMILESMVCGHLIERFENTSSFEWIS